LINSLKKEECERFFEVTGASFLFASIYSEVYKDIGIVILNNKNFVSVNLSKKGTAKQEGMEKNFLTTKNYLKNTLKVLVYFLKPKEITFTKLLIKKR